MKLNSKYLEGLRIRPDEAARARESRPRCDWPGCDEAAEHPAPKGRDREGEYFLFCREHVRRYNKSYNYFSGMADEELREWLERNVTGHRPTWKMNPRAHANGGAWRQTAGLGAGWRDPHGVFGSVRREGARPRRKLPPAVVAALEALGLPEDAEAALIKARYKKLVKELHPDANGGDRAREARLREVIAAYHNLRKARLV